MRSLSDRLPKLTLQPSNTMDRRTCLSSLVAVPVAGVLSACGGGEDAPPSRSDPLVSERVRAQSVRPLAVTNVSAVSLEGQPPLGNPQVPANPLRNYVFGPAQIQPVSDTAMANVGVGESSLRSITTGWANTAVGDNAMVYQSTGLNCVAVGAGALFSAVDAIDCTAVGANAMKTTTNGVGGTAVGRLACASLLSANNNTGVGSYAMRLSTTGVANLALGYAAGEGNLAGSENVTVGAHAARFVSGGSRNVVVGFSAMGQTVAASSDNVAVGALALTQAGGGRNVAVGTSAGSRIGIGSGNVFVGHAAGADARQDPSAINCVAIGDGAFTTGSHQVVIGNDRTEVVILGGIPITRTQLIRLVGLVAKSA